MQNSTRMRFVNESPDELPDFVGNLADTVEYSMREIKVVVDRALRRVQGKSKGTRVY